MRDSEPPGLQKKSNAVLLGKPLTMSSCSGKDLPNVYCYKLSAVCSIARSSPKFAGGSSEPVLTALRKPT